MLMMIGPVMCDIALNLGAHGGGRPIPFASHDVLGVEPVLEDMGPGNAVLNLQITIHPEHFGGLGGLEALKIARDQMLPLPVIRGDFTPLGWFVIEDVEEDHATLNGGGVGREITVKVSLRSAGSPSAGLAPSIFRLFQ
ncbi:MAG: phage tail protein [Salinarimonadaceae bacterium]|nr:MAG: phage tail protein [Salinarimonadaceae bacterium]